MKQLSFLGGVRGRRRAAQADRGKVVRAEIRSHGRRIRAVHQGEEMKQNSAIEWLVESAVQHKKAKNKPMHGNGTWIHFAISCDASSLDRAVCLIPRLHPVANVV